MISPGSIPTDALGSFTPRTFGFSAAADVHEFRTDEDDPKEKHPGERLKLNWHDRCRRLRTHRIDPCRQLALWFPGQTRWVGVRRENPQCIDSLLSHLQNYWHETAGAATRTRRSRSMRTGSMFFALGRPSWLNRGAPAGPAAFVGARFGQPSGWARQAAFT